MSGFRCFGIQELLVEPCEAIGIPVALSLAQLLYSNPVEQSRIFEPLLQVAFTRQGIPAADAAALEQSCKQQQQQQQRSLGSTGLEGITPLTALSSTARAACAAAIQVELQQMGADQQTLAHDLAVLQAVEQRPAKQQELQTLQAQLQARQAELQQLQVQLHQHEEAEQLEAAESDAQALADDGDSNAAEGEDQQAAWRDLVDAAAADVEGLQQQAASLQQLLDDWQQLVAGKKLLAVQFRLEKQQLLEGLLAQLN
jgi:hypothetical protein